jgi:5'-nucleotidase
VVSIAANNIAVNRNDSNVIPNAAIADIVTKYKALATPIANRVIGEITAAMSNSAANASGETALGDVIADAQLASTAPSGFGNAVVAFMNPGGIRSPGLTFASSVGEGDGKVTYGEAFTVQPFGNSLVTLTLTGEQIHIALEQQFVGCNATNAPASWLYPASDTTGQTFNRMLQVSNGFSYTWKSSGPACDKVDPSTIKINGVTIDPNASYRITVNNFLSDGGDKIYVLAQGTNRLGGAQDIDSFEAWLNNPAADSNPAVPGIQVAPGAQDRIIVLP